MCLKPLNNYMHDMLNCLKIEAAMLPAMYYLMAMPVDDFMSAA